MFATNVNTYINIMLNGVRNLIGLDQKDERSNVMVGVWRELEMLLNMLENGYNPHSFYDADIIASAKHLIKEK